MDARDDRELDEITVPPTDPALEAKRRGLGNSYDASVDPETLRNGGPTSSDGVRTTTGSNAGPGGVGRPGPRRVQPGAAPTTTGDATTGGMQSTAAGTTSDASGPAAETGEFSDQ